VGCSIARIRVDVEQVGRSNSIFVISLDNYRNRVLNLDPTTFFERTNTAIKFSFLTPRFGFDQEVLSFAFVYQAERELGSVVGIFSNLGSFDHLVAVVYEQLAFCDITIQEA